MALQKFRWSKHYEASEEELINLLHVRNITAERITSETLKEVEQRINTSDATLWCGEGTLVIRVKGNGIKLQSGDALRIPADTAYDVEAGTFGYTYYESTP